MVALGVVGRANLQFAVGNFRLPTAPGKLVAQLDEPLHGFRAEAVAAIGETHGPQHFGFGLIKRAVHQRQFPREPGGVFRLGKVGVRPTVIADLETQLVDFTNLLPRHEIRPVVHPLVRDEERGTEAQLFQERRDERAMRFDRVVKGEHHQLVRDSSQGCAKRARWSERQQGDHQRAAQESVDGVQRQSPAAHKILLPSRRQMTG